MMSFRGKCLLFYNFFNNKNIYHFLIFTIIILGVASRFVQFLYNRSLWLDEAMLALNMVQLNYHELFKPLIWYQAGPILFLIAAKFISSFFEYSEYGLRLIPFLSGILSLILFRKLALVVLQKPIAAISAISMFAFSFYAIYFSVEFKQYSSDVLFTIILLLIAFNTHKNNVSKRSTVIFGIIGVIAIFSSHTSIFILAGAGSALLIDNFLRKKNYINSESIKLFMLSFVWIIVFGINYIFTVRGTNHDVFYSYWAAGFAPIFPTSFADLVWYPKSAFNIVTDPLGFLNIRGFTFAAVVFLAGLSGLASFALKKSYFILLMLCLPLFFLLVASSLELYPIKGRLIFFTVPLFYLLIAEGGYQIYNNLNKIHIVVGAAFIVMLLCSPVYSGIKLLVKPHLRQETKPLVEYLKNEIRGGEKVYVYYGSVPAFEYYTRNFKLPYIQGKYARNKLDLCVAEIHENVGNGSLWILFSNIPDNDLELITQQLGKFGKIEKIKKTIGASLYKF